MGIFGSDRNNQVAQPATDQPIPQNTPSQQSYIDDVMPAQANGNDPVMQQSVNDLLSQTAPTMDDTDAPADDYLLATNPIPEHEEHTEHNEAPQPEAPQHHEEQPLESTDDLTAIKQQALQQLSPLVNHLEQSPEERFHTTMMMLQATDDQSLVKTAYEAAQAITDEKTRAQALLDIVNEINYFTQQKK